MNEKKWEHVKIGFVEIIIFPTFLANSLKSLTANQPGYSHTFYFMNDDIVMTRINSV